MKALAELIPQVFFDMFARYIPGLVLFGSWILLLGQDDWQSLLSTVVGASSTAAMRFRSPRWLCCSCRSWSGT